MLPSTPEEEDSVRDYYLGQSHKLHPEVEVHFLQKVYAETIMGHRHDVWDLHASDGRWWIITNPTNLYSQEQFPNMDYAVTFHMGLCLRMPRTERQRRDDRHLRPIATVLRKIEDLEPALHQAQNEADYQAVGVRCREALLAFIDVVQDMAEWTAGERPQRANFKAWTDLICDQALAGSSQKSRRHLFKTMLLEAWTFSNWLTHAQWATWQDAEAAQSTVAHVVGHALSMVLRHVRSVPEMCPQCGSRHLVPEEGVLDEPPEIIWERPVCEDCGWTGDPTPIAEEPAENDSLITREGQDEDGCYIPQAPLRKLRRPGDH